VTTTFHLRFFALQLDEVLAAAPWLLYSPFYGSMSRSGIGNNSSRTKAQQRNVSDEELWYIVAHRTLKIILNPMTEGKVGPVGELIELGIVSPVSAGASVSVNRLVQLSLRLEGVADSTTAAAARQGLAAALGNSLQNPFKLFFRGYEYQRACFPHALALLDRHSIRRQAGSLRLSRSVISWIRLLLVEVLKDSGGLMG